MKDIIKTAKTTESKWGRFILFNPFKLPAFTISASIIAILLFFMPAVQAQTSSVKHELRVVSLSPRVTETIFMLGQGGCLVGRSSACDYPAAVKNLPIVGNFGGPFLEHLAMVNPDYVLVGEPKSKATERAIKEMGAQVIVLEDLYLDDYIKSVKTLGELLHCPKKAALEIVRFTQALEKFKREADKIPVASRPKVFVEIWHRPLMTCGRKTFINEMIEYAGGRNIGSEEDVQSFTCSFEWVMQQNPDVIICPAMGAGNGGKVTRRHGWEHISAVKNRRIHTGFDQDKLYRLGPRTIEGIALLRQYLHPGDPQTSGGVEAATSE